MASCERCGNELPTEAQFCDHCGSRHTTSVQVVRENPMKSPAVRKLLQQAEGLRTDGQLGEALDLIQEAAEQVGSTPAWVKLEYSMRASIARSAVEADEVGEPLPGLRYEPMTLLARIEGQVDVGPSINPALLALVTGDQLIRIPSGVFEGSRGPVEGTLEELEARGEARSVPLPGLRASRIQCGWQGGRVFVGGCRTDGDGYALAVHHPDTGWTEAKAPLEAEITALALGAQGRRLVVGTSVGQVLLFDTEGNRCAYMGSRFLARTPVVRCGVAEEGDLVFAWTGRGDPILVGPLISAGSLRRLGVPHADVTDVCVAGGGRLVATIDEVGQLCFFRIADTRKVGQTHLPVLQDPQLRIAGTDPSHELAVIRPGGATLHCYEFRYLVFVGEPVHVVRTKPEKLPDGGQLELGPQADFVVHEGGGQITVYKANMTPALG
jgi:hypothetical protein